MFIVYLSIEEKIRPELDNLCSLLGLKNNRPCFTKDRDCGLRSMTLEEEGTPENNSWNTRENQLETVGHIEKKNSQVDL